MELAPKCIGRIFEDGVTELSDVVSHMTSYDLEILGHHGIAWQNMGDVGQSPLGSPEPGAVGWR